MWTAARVVGALGPAPVDVDCTGPGYGPPTPRRIALIELELAGRIEGREKRLRLAGSRARERPPWTALWHWVGALRACLMLALAALDVGFYPTPLPRIADSVDNPLYCSVKLFQLCG